MKKFLLCLALASSSVFADISTTHLLENGDVYAMFVPATRVKQDKNGQLLVCPNTKEVDGKGGCGDWFSSNRWTHVLDIKHEGKSPIWYSRNVHNAKGAVIIFFNR